MVDDSNLNLRLGPTIVDVDNGQHVPGQISSISTSLTTFKSSISIFKRKRVLPLARLELVFDAMLVTLSFHLDDDDFFFFIGQVDLGIHTLSSTQKSFDYTAETRLHVKLSLFRYCPAV